MKMTIHNTVYNACIFFAGIIIFCSSCSNIEEHSDTLFFTYADTDVVNISPAFEFGMEQIEIGGRIAISGDFLIVSELSMSPPIHLFNLIDQNYTQFGATGRGPGEFLTTDHITIPEDGKLGVNDPQLKRYSIVKIDDLTISGIINYNVPGMAFNVIPHENGFYADGLLPGGLIADIQENGELSGYVMKLPDIESSRIPPLEKAKQWMNSAVYNPDMNKIATGFFRADRLKIIDLDDKSSLDIIGPDSFDPVFGLTETDDSRIVTHQVPESRLGYISGFGTSELIFFLYSGQYTGENFSNYARYIHVFNWDGKLIKVLKSDEYLYSLAFHEKSGKLFGMVMEPIPKLVSFNLDFIK